VSYFLTILISNHAEKRLQHTEKDL